MRKTTCTCDRCGMEIADGVVYALTCYAEDVHVERYMSNATITQNHRQNAAIMVGKKDLCQKCKDELTDGLFIV